MAPSFESSGEELVEAGGAGGFVYEAAREDDDVGIVVLADEVSNLGAPYQAGAHALMLVQGHRDALARTADCDAGIDAAVLDGVAQSVTEVTVVARGFAIGAEVLVLVALLLEVLLDELFQRVASVVRCETDYMNGVHTELKIQNSKFKIKCVSVL